MDEMEAKLAAKDSEILRLRQMLETRPVHKVRDGLQVETRCVRLSLVSGSGLGVTDSVVAERYAQMVAEQAADGFKLVSGPFGDSQSLRYMFERTNRPGVSYFNMNDLVRELEKLLTGEEWTAGQRIQLKELPDGFTDWVEQVLKAIRPKFPSGHLIGADEMALILMRVALHFAPDEEFARRWRTSVRRSTVTGDGQYQCHIDDGVVDHMDNHMQRLLGDPMEGYE